MKNRFSNAVIAAAAIAVPFASVRAADVLVGDQAQLVAALQGAHPGDNILLRDGVWTNLNIGTQTVNGTAAAPINIRAQTPGQVAISGPNYVFGLAGSNYTVSGLTFKDENNELKSLRFRGSNVRVFDNAVLMGGRYNQLMWDVQSAPGSDPNANTFDHNFLAGKQDRGTLLVLDGALYPQVRSNYFGSRTESGPSGHTNGWETIRIGNSNISAQTIGANVEGNYFEGAEGEFETISDKTQDNRVADNTFRNISEGWLTARLGGGGTYEGNSFINHWGIRVGNADDAIPDHPGLTIRNNYLEGANAKIVLPANQTDVKIQDNTVFVGPGAFRSTEHTTGKYPLEYNNTTAGTLSGNVFVINDASYGVVQARALNSINPSGAGTNNLIWNQASGTNLFASGTPSNVQSWFSAANPNLVRDAYGVLRPSTSGPGAGMGFQQSGGPLARFSDVGPSWLSPAMRLNKFEPAEFGFNGDLSGGSLSYVAHNTGYLSSYSTLKDGAGNTANLHSTDGAGVSGLPGDRAFDNRATASMGATTSGAASVEDRTWFRDLEAFTITGWFKTDGTQQIGNGASLIEQTDAAGGWSLRANTAGKLTLAINDGTTARSVTSPSASYAAANQWTFFAVSFDRRPSSNEVSFYAGTDAASVTLVGQQSLGATASSDAVRSALLIGKGFDGLLDDVCLFTARKDVTWTDEDGLTYTRSGAGFNYGLLNLQELRTLWQYDLRIPRGDLNRDRAVNATDIDLSFANRGNVDYDLDGDGDADQGDVDLLVRNVLRTEYGDANLDGRVDLVDFTYIASNFNLTGRHWADADFTGDGKVDLTDFALLAKNFNFVSDGGGAFGVTSAALGATVPEPTSFMLMFLSLSVCSRPQKKC